MRSYRIGSLFGIPIQLDVTFLLVLPLFAYLIAGQVGETVGLVNQLPRVAIDPGALETQNVRWIVGTAAAVGLFASVVLHELGHSLTAMRFGYTIDSITLWIFGGIAALSEMPEDWKQELAVAIAGPIVSLGLGALAYVAVAFVVPQSLAAVAFVVAYLAVMNVALAVFNMLPGFPMDGGRVLRALLARTRPYAKATQIAATVGKGFAVLLGLFGLLTTQWLMIGIAFFIYVGASGESQQVVMKEVFDGVTVADVMTPRDRLHTVTPETSVADLVERMFRERHTGYPVLDDGHLAGIVTLADAKDVQPVERDAYTVADVMSTDLKTIESRAAAMDALQQIQGDDVGRLLVVDGDDLVGLVSRTDLVTAFNVIQESGRLASGSTEPANDPERGLV
ncbi:CBS domain-containing protein [Halorubellus sp. JP-L1]|uniref:site-2 protease family protein n=1 Tax=Halorubellus sp. JP-L1 TaxID=2715753 RepID=UPI00140A68B1|nr:site-2 protease family protein [Halorubellus sp. JP-L1]NHN41801.1 CBS domain-containing protein [Halorubellus sp. JP-L1]